MPEDGAKVARLDLAQAQLVDHLKAARATGDATLRDGRAYMVAPLYREVHARRRPELRSIVRVDDRDVEVRHVAGKCDVELASVAEEELAARRIEHAEFQRAAQLTSGARSRFVRELQLDGLHDAARSHVEEGEGRVARRRRRRGRRWTTWRRGRRRRKEDSWDALSDSEREAGEDEDQNGALSHFSKVRNSNCTFVTPDSTYTGFGPLDTCKVD